MPPDSNKRRTTKSASPPNPDHRKRRRNRTTQSCLNCHATKRMCDRKRPCSRCTQLGLTGLCVYEVDDPSARQADAQDESSRLLHRIAELEGVVRELKNRPHPRWVDSIPLDFTVAAPGSPLRSPSYVDINLQPPFGDIPWSNLFNWDSRSSDSSYSRSPGSTPSPLLIPASRPPDPFPCLDSTWNQNVAIPGKSDPGCNCMSEAACYNITLDWRPSFEGQGAKISELESFTMDALQNSRICPDALSAAVRTNGARRPASRGRPGEQQVKLITRDLFWDENGLPAYDDSFMSWIPPAAALQKHI